MHHSQSVFERFTQEARQVVVWAQEEARALKHNYIGTEHLLLGLLREEEQREDGEQTLGSLGVTLTGAREKVMRIVGPGEEASRGQIPFTPRAKKVLELALREALSHGHNWIAPEHILLGLAREDEGVASRVLLEFDTDAEKIRAGVTRALATRPLPTGSPPLTRSSAARLPMEPSWFDGIDAVLMRLTVEIRAELGREPDAGDLLITLACAEETAAGKALRELGVDLDALWGRLERIRQQRASEREELMRRISDLEIQKQRALERQDFKQAARLRDKQRELSAGLEAGFEQDLLREVRRRLGLSRKGG
jgi:ATP-dependent Clp protease ATP-binding subunit ClpA